MEQSTATVSKFAENDRHTMHKPHHDMPYDSMDAMLVIASMGDNEHAGRTDLLLLLLLLSIDLVENRVNGVFFFFR